jgi:hypothetical protein
MDTDYLDAHAFTFEYRGETYYDHDERIYNMDGLLLGIVASRGEQYAFTAYGPDEEVIYRGGGNAPSASDREGNLIHDPAMEGILAAHYNRALDAVRKAGL